MKCRKCGAMIRDTDVYCAKCGWKVERKNRYPRQETLEIPIAAIEQNIIETTEKELDGIARPLKDNYAKMNNRKKYLEEDYREASYEEIDYEEMEDEEYYGDDEEDYEEIEDDYEEDDFDDIEDEDEEDGRNRLFTIMMAGTAFLILAIAAFVGFRLIRNLPIRNYGSGHKSIVKEDEPDAWEDDELTGEGAGDILAGTIVIQSNVNVRDNPSTENSQILKVAKAGEHYEYFGMSEDGSWYIVLLEDGSKAYIFKDYAAVE